MVSMERLQGTLVGFGLIGFVLWLKSAFSETNTILGTTCLIGILVIFPSLIEQGLKKLNEKREYLSDK